MGKQEVEELRLWIKKLLDESTEANWTVEKVDEIYDVSFECTCDQGYMKPIHTGYAEGKKSVIGMAFDLAANVKAMWGMRTYKMEHPEEFVKRTYDHYKT